MREFLEEFYPLYLFSQSNYIPMDAEVKVILGNQGYEAIVKLASGETYQIEITEYIDGKAENEGAKLINERGYSKMRIGDTRNLRTKAFDYLKYESSCRNKCPSPAGIKHRNFNALRTKAVNILIVSDVNTNMPDSLDTG